MADIPDLDKTEFIFVGQVTAVAQPKSTHGKMLQDVSYTRISIKMGLKSNLRDPMTVFHDVTKSPLPTDLVKVGNTLIVGGSGGSEETYVHKADQATLKAIHDALEALVEKLVTAYLKDHDFDITLTQQMGKENQAYLGPDLLSLDEIADRVWSQVRNKVGDASEASIENIRKYVDQYYRQSVEEWKKSGSSQVLVQLGQAPAIPFWASRAQPPGYLRSWHQGQQFTAGWQSSQLGWIHTGQLSLSLFDNPDGLPIFSNALAAYQFSYSTILGPPIYAKGSADNWGYLVGSVFGQVGVGLNNISANPNSWNQIQLHIMHQEQAGLQLGFNIWKITIIVQGAVVYSGNSFFGIANQGGSTLGAALFGGIQFAN